MCGCEIVDCGRPATASQSGILVCERCRIEFVSVGPGAVRFAGRWHGVTGARYTPEQVAAFPGLAAQS